MVLPLLMETSSEVAKLVDMKDIRDNIQIKIKVQRIPVVPLIAICEKIGVRPCCVCETRHIRHGREWRQEVAVAVVTGVMTPRGPLNRFCRWDGLTSRVDFIRRKGKGLGELVFGGGRPPCLAHNLEQANNGPIVPTSLLVLYRVPPQIGRRDIVPEDQKTIDQCVYCERPGEPDHVMIMKYLKSGIDVSRQCSTIFPRAILTDSILIKKKWALNKDLYCIEATNT